MSHSAGQSASAKTGYLGKCASSIHVINSFHYPRKILTVLGMSNLRKRQKNMLKISRIPEYSGTGRGDMTDQSAMKFREINDMIKFIRRFIRN